MIRAIGKRVVKGSLSLLLTLVTAILLPIVVFTLIQQYTSVIVAVMGAAMVAHLFGYIEGLTKVIFMEQS